MNSSGMRNVLIGIAVIAVAAIFVLWLDPFGAPANDAPRRAAVDAGAPVVQVRAPVEAGAVIPAVVPPQPAASALPAKASPSCVSCQRENCKNDEYPACDEMKGLAESGPGAGSSRA